MSTFMGYEPYYPTASSFSGSSSNVRRWYADVATPDPQVAVGARRGRTEAHSYAYSSHASPVSSSTRLRYSSSPHGGGGGGGGVGRVFRSSAASFSSSAVDRELSQAAQISSQFREARTRERAQLQELNDRFAGFVDRVHELELQNRSLEAELDALRRHAQTHRLGALYEQEARALRDAVELAQAERREALGRRENLERALGDLEARRRQEELARRETEARLPELRDEADRAALARAEVEKRTETLLDELAFVKKIHEEELCDLHAQAQLQARAQAELEGEAAAGTAGVLDLSGALRDIRAQYEGLAAKNAHAAEEWFRGKAGTMSESVARHSHAARASKDEAGEVRGQLQIRLLDIDACRGVNCSLERQLADVEERQAAEVADLQELTAELEGELGSIKQEMSSYLKDYQDLLNVKMALDIEIAAYRKLLEGEESRFSSVGAVGGASSSLQYRSHSVVSAVAPPSFSRPQSAPGVWSPGSYLATLRVPLRSTLVASRSRKVEATPRPEEEEEEKEKETEEEVEAKDKVEVGDKDKEAGADEEGEKPEMTEDTKEGAEGQEETKETEVEEETEDKEATERVAEKEVSGDVGESGGVKQAGKEDKDKGDKKGEEDKVEKAKEEKEEKEKKKTDEVKPEMKGEKEGGKEGGKGKEESERPREEPKKEEAATEITKKGEK